MVELGKRRPFLLPTVIRPQRRVPEMLALTTGMWSASSASKTLQSGRVGGGGGGGGGVAAGKRNHGVGHIGVKVHKRCIRKI